MTDYKILPSKVTPIERIPYEDTWPEMKRLLDLNRLADVAIAERDTDGTNGYESTVNWTNEVRPQVVLDLIADVLRLREAIRTADDFLNVKGDPIAAHITLREAIYEPRGGRFGGDW